MVLGELEGVIAGGDGVHELLWRVEKEQGAGGWGRRCLGTFYVKPNYPGRSSHICNGGFIVTDAARNRGVGRLMGEGYLEWAPKLVSFFFGCFEAVVRKSSLEKKMRIVFLCLSLVFFLFFSHVSPMIFYICPPPPPFFLNS